MQKRWRTRALALRSTLASLGVLFTTAALAGRGHSPEGRDISLLVPLVLLFAFFAIEIWWATSRHRTRAHKPVRIDTPERHDPDGLG